MRYLPHIYSTVMHDPDTDISMFYISVPVRTLPAKMRVMLQSAHVARGMGVSDADFRWTIEEANTAATLVREHLGLRPNLDFPVSKDPVGTVTQLIEMTLKAPPDDPAPEKYGLRGMPVITRKFFAETAIIPFENSPVTGISLSDVLHASGAAVGAYAGFIMVHEGPLLLVTVPAGMVLCGIASGLSHGLEEGIRQRLVKLFKEF
ncbi:hypothetical protein [Paraburkholderia sp. J7]|uniref:hypothetical protein n=1 Tax=Paraburkholderia sp. J7 TaxID=2805438 RepID=UPI002AB5E253|nr:hypothetical protein [Paraburkholderia sp. J7]